MIGFIVKIYSYFLLLSLTDDNNFGTNDLKKKKFNPEYKPSYRISLLNIILGDMIIYIITYNISDKKFLLFHKIMLEKCGSVERNYSNSAVSERVKKYDETHLSTLPDSDADIECEFIEYLNNGQRERISLSERKITFYTTIILAIISIILAIFNISVLINYTFVEKILSFFIAYSLINITLLIFGSMKVKSYSFSMFSTLRQSADKKKQLIKNYYSDWQTNTASAELWVSYVLNIEAWLKGGLVLAILLAISVNYNSYKSIANGNNVINMQSEVITLNMDEIDNIYSQSRISLTNLQLKAQAKTINKIIVIIPDDMYRANVSNMFNQYTDTQLEFFTDISLKGRHEIKLIWE